MLAGRRRGSAGGPPRRRRAGAGAPSLAGRGPRAGRRRMRASASMPSTRRGPGRLNQELASSAQTAPRWTAGSAAQSGLASSARAPSTMVGRSRPQGSTMITPGARSPRNAAIASQVVRKEGSPARPITSRPPAASICSGTQWPPMKGGSSHSIASTRGRLGRPASRTAARRARRPAVSVRAAALVPVASPTCSMEAKTAARVVGERVSTRAPSCSSWTARCTWPALTAQTSQRAWVRMRSGCSPRRRGTSMV